MNNYTLVLEYADSGTLKTYLNDHLMNLNGRINLLRIAVSKHCVMFVMFT